MVDATLKELDAWFNEPGHSLERTNLLSKLATIELCGWLEEEFDRLIRLAANGRIANVNWVETDVIEKTNGFVYAKHWRSMLCKVVGEFHTCRVEAAMEVAHPADLQQLRTLLSQLWKDRCSFAHADLAANMANTQLTFNAPSLAINRYNQLKGILSRYQVVMLTELPAP